MNGVLPDTDGVTAGGREWVVRVRPGNHVLVTIEDQIISLQFDCWWHRQGETVMAPWVAQAVA